ncbi:hypothetical protein AQJ23_01065 [Streptomyces antibioticus]|nr:hypothetical protein AQJ23_01065 [Streptomyces antibioticus]
MGSLLGVGFPAWTGGVVQYINRYQGGLRGFVARAHELAGRYGERFTPPALLLNMAAEGCIFRTFGPALSTRSRRTAPAAN